MTLSISTSRDPRSRLGLAWVRVAFRRGCAFFVLLFASSAPGNPPPEVVAEHGSVDESGKFVPAVTLSSDSVPPVDPADWRKQAREIMEDLGSGSYRIGEVLIHAGEQTVSLPARINAHRGLIEYALVTEKGKIHESLLATRASPWHVHLGALLIGLAAPDEDAPPQDVEIVVEWETNGPRRSHRLEELIALAKESPWGPVGGTLEAGAWSYHGSIVDSLGFAAAREGSLITLIGDFSALVVNPRPGHVDDGLHVPNADLLPPEEFPVTVILRPAREVPSTTDNPDSHKP